MPVWLFWINIVFILLYLTDAATSGPYRSSIVSVEKCKAPSHPYMKDPPITLIPKVHNVSNTLVLNGNVTISRDAKNIKHKMKSFIWEGGAWRLNYIMNDINCHSMLLYLICTASSVKYDRNNCMYLKGQYFYSNLDVNAITHLWAKVMEYGKIMWRIESFSQKLCLYCYNFEVVTVPA